jgi:benzoyl-CoA-dihydrodiol lyase
MMIDFQTDPSRYKHWKLSFDGAIATLALDVAEDGGLKEGYELKLNSYDLGVDIELYDAIQRLRFEHPEVKTVVITSGKDRVFCAGANIRMLRGSTHDHKVNFCKFTNETRNYIEDATEFSGQTYICAVNGSCAGGGYELALACDQIILMDDGSSTVSLPEVPLLAVLPGTGGLTRLADKRKVRRDRADFFCTLEEGIRGKRATAWNLVDQVVPRSKFADAVQKAAVDAAGKSDRPADGRPVILTPLKRTISDNSVEYDTVRVDIDHRTRIAEFMISGPSEAAPENGDAANEQGVDFWPMKLARELDDAILHMRINEIEVGVWTFRSQGDADVVASYDAVLDREQNHWFIREVRHYLKRVLKRVDLSARTIFTLIEPGSCFTGTLLELSFASDRTYMLDGQFEGDNRPPATVRMTAMNFGPYTMPNGLTRLESRFIGEPDTVGDVKAEVGKDIIAVDAEELGLITFAPDDIDWEDEVRIAIEERAALSPDALTGMEASLRFAGPETMETKIFARLSAWQNWIFQRPNAVGEQGALSLYGTGQRSDFDKRRV